MTDDDRAKIKKAGYTYAGGDKLGYQRYSDTFHHDTKDSITVHHEDGKVTKVLKGGNWLGGGSSHKTVADALKEETKLKTFKQFVAEAFDPWADHSGEYQLKKGEAKPTEVHSGQARGWDKAKAPKHIMHVIHRKTGEEIGKIEPYSAYQDKKKPGSRIVDSRKSVTRHSFSFHKGHGPAIHEMSTYVHMKHISPAEALRAMARVHQTHLQKKSEMKEATEPKGFPAGAKVTYQKNKTTRGNATVTRFSTAKKTPHYYINTETEGSILVPASELQLVESVGQYDHSSTEYWHPVTKHRIWS